MFSSKAKIAELEKQNEALTSAFMKRCILVDVVKVGRELIFKFQRDGKAFEVSTFAEMGVDVAAIKEQAGLS